MLEPLYLAARSQSSTDISDELEIDTLRDWFFEFPYMERLRDEQVLADAIRAAVADIPDEAIGYAEAKDDAGHYIGLQLSRHVEPRFGRGALIFRHSAARAQLDAAGAAYPTTGSPGPGGVNGDVSSEDQSPDSERRPTRFVGAIELDALRGLSKAGQVFESVINELDREPGTKSRITLEIQADSDDGFPKDVEDVVADNAGTLGFFDKRFD